MDTERNATYGEIRSDPDFRWERIHDKTELEAFYRRIIPAISAAAREYGYAIGVHGSLQRDLDLIAAPWREGACDHETLARVVHKAACGLVSESYTWEVKPGGRYACSFPVCWTEKSETFKRETSLGCIDLSVMPFVTLSEKAMSKIVEASAPQIEEAARNMAKAAVIGVGVGPLPSALSAEVRRFQGGLTNAQLAEAWEKKLPGVTPTDRELSAFAIGIEVGETLTRSATAASSDAIDAARYRWLRNDALQVIVAGPVVCAADKWGKLEKQDNGDHIAIDGQDLDRRIDDAIATLAASDSGKADK